MGLYSGGGGAIFGRIFVSEIWGLIFEIFSVQHSEDITSSSLSRLVMKIYSRILRFWYEPQERHKQENKKFVYHNGESC